MPRYIVVPFALVILLAASPADAARDAGPAPAARGAAAPTGLRAFLLTAAEPQAHVYPRTPSFTWSPVRRPGVYQFQLAMSRSFGESQVLFENMSVKQPALAIPLQLPWMTGRPYALWAHVRFKAADGRTTSWSAPFGFDMRWNATDVPKQEPAPVGLVRWAPVEGATAYEVLYPDEVPAVSFYTTTNVADEREFWTFHDSAGVGRLRWRVRAIRYIDEAKPLPNALPRVSFGPWSAIFTTVNPPTALALGLLTPAATVSDADAAGQQAQAHALTPGFAWTGAISVPGIDAGSALSRVYVSTDDHCVNTVFVGAVVGGPAYAPRIYGGPLTLPQNMKDLATWQSGRFKVGGSEGNAFDATGQLVYTNENPEMPVGGTRKTAEPATLNGRAVARTDLWDSGWPNGRYYWTVVAVSVVTTVLEKPTTDTAAETSPPIEYHDVQVPQDACEAGRMLSFGKTSKPVVASAATPYASGVSPSGRLTAAATPKPRFHATPLVAWEPAMGAQGYNVQWSRTRYPWQPEGSLTTPATAVVLPIRKPGVWYYRVRGVNAALPPGAQMMTWSTPVAISISGEVWKVVR